MNLSRFIPSGPGFLAGALTAAIITVANKVFHVHLLSSSVETAVTPFVAFLAAAVAHQEPKLAHDLESDPLVEHITAAISARLKSNPLLEDEIVHLALGLLGNVESEPVVKKIVQDITHDEPVVVPSVVVPAEVAQGNQEGVIR